jgi:hypothetical protein
VKLWGYQCLEEISIFLVRRRETVGVVKLEGLGGCLGYRGMIRDGQKSQEGFSREIGFSIE